MDTLTIFGLGYLGLVFSLAILIRKLSFRGP